MCSYTACILVSYCQIIVLSVRATVGSTHGVLDYCVVTQSMVAVVVRAVHGSTVEQRFNSSSSAVSHSSPNVDKSGDHYPRRQAR